MTDGIGWADVKEQMSRGSAIGYKVPFALHYTSDAASPSP